MYFYQSFQMSPLVTQKCATCAIDATSEANKSNQQVRLQVVIAYGSESCTRPSPIVITTTYVISTPRHRTFLLTTTVSKRLLRYVLTYAPELTNNEAVNSKCFIQGIH